MKTVLLAAVAALTLSTAALAAEGGSQAYNPAAVGVPSGFDNGTLAQLRDQQFAKYYQQQAQQLAAQNGQTSPAVPGQANRG